MDINSKHNDFFWGALAGGTVAALTTLLFTTKKGKQLQSQIEDAYNEVEEVVKSKFADSKEKLEDAAENVHKKIALCNNSSKLRSKR